MLGSRSRSSQPTSGERSTSSRRKASRCIAVAFVNSYANPAHELAAERLLRALGFTGDISLSHEVSGEYREYERTSTTVVDAYVRPQVSAYLAQLARRLDGPRLGRALVRHELGRRRDDVRGGNGSPVRDHRLGSDGRRCGRRRALPRSGDPAGDHRGCRRDELRHLPGHRRAPPDQVRRPDCRAGRADAMGRRPLDRLRRGIDRLRRRGRPAPRRAGERGSGSRARLLQTWRLATDGNRRGCEARHVGAGRARGWGRSGRRGRPRGTRTPGATLLDGRATASRSGSSRLRPRRWRTRSAR